MEQSTARRSAARVSVAVLVLGLALVVAVTPLPAQTAAISAEGVVESTSGGFKFPDGSVQTTAASPGSAPVEDTGQQRCWNAGGEEIGCSGTGQDGELQRGVDWPTPRFTDNFNGTVTDTLTGLIWLKLADCIGQRTWEQALTDANGLMDGPCGLTDGSVATDWRLPSIKELLSLVDYGESDPVLPQGHPFTSVESASYWSSSSRVANPDFAWVVNMFIGFDTTFLKTNLAFVWPVRGGQ